MIIHTAAFVKSSPTLKECPAPAIPEFGFIGTVKCRQIIADKYAYRLVEAGKNICSAW